MTVRCHLCESTQSQIVSQKDKHGNDLETRACLGCGLVFNHPVPSDAELARFYRVDYRTDYKGSEEPSGRQIVRNFIRTRDHIDRYFDMFEPAQSVLDVGAGSGEFVFAMDMLGKRAVGIEPNEGYSTYCRSQLHVDVLSRQISDAKFKSKSFDLINLSHVLEHLNDPVAALSKLAGWLKDDGVLYVEVPNVFDYARTKSMGKMFHYGHINNFSPWTLRKAAERAGFEECEESRKRSSGKTGVFFRKSAQAIDARDAINAEHAAQVVSALDTHYAGWSMSKLLGWLPGKIKNFVVKQYRQLSTTLSSMQHDDAAAIGASVLEPLTKKR